MKNPVIISKKQTQTQTSNTSEKQELGKEVIYIYVKVERRTSEITPSQRIYLIFSMENSTYAYLAYNTDSITQSSELKSPTKATFLWALINSKY